MISLSPHSSTDRPPRRFRGKSPRACDRANAKASAMSDSNDLDFRLYAWLSEADEQRADLRFSSYFKAAFPALCHYVRSLGQSSATAEDIAQQALIKLFNHLGGTRRLAAEEVRGATAR